MSQSRREFLKTAIALTGASLLPDSTLGTTGRPVSLFSVNRISSTSSSLRLRFYSYPLQLAHVFTVATHSRITTPDVQVEIEYEGTVGYGEASMPPYLGETVESVETFLREVNLSQFNDPFRLEDILSYVDEIAPGNTAAKAAIDIALHDLVGKLLGAPWYKLWGLDPLKAPSTTYTIGIDTPEVVKMKTREVSGQFNILKVKLGGPHDKQMIEAIREITPLPLAVDANQGWTHREYALDFIHWLKEQGVVLIEQPMPKEQLENIAWITQQSPLPIFADESLQRLSDVSRMKGVFSGINIKLMKCTGLREAWKMVILARALGMQVMIGCMTETSCAISAAAQLSPAVDFADLDGNLLIKNDLFEGMKVVNGRITLTDQPGIGVFKRQDLPGMP